MTARGIRGSSDRSVLVLTSLAGGPKHGYALIKDVESFAGIKLGPGTLVRVSRQTRASRSRRGAPFRRPSAPLSDHRIGLRDRKGAARRVRPDRGDRFEAHCGCGVLKDRLVRWMLVLYPRSWRRRYGEEVGDLSEELLAAGEVTRLRLGLELVRSAFVERVHRRRAFVLLSSCAAVVLLVGVVLFATHGPGRGFSANGNGGTSTTVASSTTTTNPISPDALPSSIPGHIDALGYAHYSDVYGGVVATDGEAHLDVYLTDLDPSIESAFAALAPRGDISFLSTAEHSSPSHQSRAAN